MGYTECNMIMESNTGSVSSGPRSRAGGRRQNERSIPFCSGSSNKLTQSIIRDHMVAHYKKLYSAKATIDNSVPKSMLHSTKYKDQIRKEQVRKLSRPQSAYSILQRSSAASLSSIESRTTEQNNESRLFSRISTASSPQFYNSFHPNDIVYSACKGGSHRPRPASERKYGSPEATPRRQQSTCSLGGSREQESERAFQDPVKKTYSGDLMRKHSHHFTQDKPFTPKTLKTDKTSYLSNYRYYRSPKRKPTQDCNTSVRMEENTSHRSTKDKEGIQEHDEPSEINCTEDGRSKDNQVNGTFLFPPRQESRLTTRDKHYNFSSSSRILPDSKTSSALSHVTAEEEELLYLEFISAVTEDILSRGHISDRVLNHVMQKHINMNLHQLDGGKMCHLLEVLRKELDEPLDTSNSGKKEDHYLDEIFYNLHFDGRKSKTKKDYDTYSDASSVDINFPKYTDGFLASTPILTPERANSENLSENDTESNDEQNAEDTLSRTEKTGDNSSSGEMDFPQGDTGTNDAGNDDKHTSRNNDSDQSVEAGIHLDRQSKELEDLGRSLSELLHVASITLSDEEETAAKQPKSTVGSTSDDEF